MERLLKHCAFWGALLAYWLGVVSEAIATCLLTVVCAPTHSFVYDALLIAFFGHMLFTAVRCVINFKT